MTNSRMLGLAVLLCTGMFSGGALGEDAKDGELSPVVKPCSDASCRNNPQSPGQEQLDPRHLPGSGRQDDGSGKNTEKPERDGGAR